MLSETVHEHNKSQRRQLFLGEQLKFDNDNKMPHFSHLMLHCSNTLQCKTKFDFGLLCAKQYYATLPFLSSTARF